MNNINKKGFTLLELVIVIGILAVLGAVSVLVLNPAQLFAQARDTTRLNDIGVMRNAIALYVSTVSSPDMDGSLACATDCFVNDGTGMAANCGGRHAVARVTTPNLDRAVDGTGWIPVNFTAVSGGPALSVLPVDPTKYTDGSAYFYSYACDNTTKTYELNANLESTRYTSGDDNREDTDGGDDDNIYEVGTDSGLDL